MTEQKRIPRYETALNAVFYDPALGQTGLHRLRERVKQSKNITIPYQYVRGFLARQAIAQQTAEPPRTRTTPMHYYIQKPGGLLEMDLLMVSQAYEGGPKQILTVIDVASRKLAMRPLLTKTNKEVVEALKDIFEKELTKPPKRVQSDPGTEFIGAPVRAYLESIGCAYRALNPRQHAFIAERVHRTIAPRLYRTMDTTLDRDFTKILPGIVEAYNNERHGTIGMAPNVAYEKDSIDIRVQPLLTADKHSPLFSLGDRVRVRLPVTDRLRSVDFTYTPETYEVTGVFPWRETPHPLPNRYELEYSKQFIGEEQLLLANVVERQWDVGRWNAVMKDLPKPPPTQPKKIMRPKPVAIVSAPPPTTTSKHSGRTIKKKVIKD